MGKTLFVGYDDEKYSKIQDAIDDASDGDLIVVHNGDYKENLKINKRVTLLCDGRVSLYGNVVIDYEGVYVQGLSIFSHTIVW